MVDDFQGTVTIAESMFLGGNRLLENNVHFFFQVKMMPKELSQGRGESMTRRGAVDGERGSFREDGCGRLL